MDGRPRSINVAAMEQSNGFSILGGPPPDGRSLGVGGHVRDKDGTLAALLVAEVAAWAKEQGTTLYELIDKHVYLDPDVGLFVNYYEPDPIDGEYPGHRGRPQEEGNPPPGAGLLPTRPGRRPGDRRPPGHFGRDLSHRQVRRNLPAQAPTSSSPTRACVSISATS